MTRADDGFTLRRAPGWPLAVVLGLHALLAWWWWLAPRPAAPDAGLAPRVFLVVPVWTAPSPVPQGTAPALPRPRTPAPRALVVPRPALADEPQAITAEAAAPSADSPSSSPDSPADPFAPPPPAAAAPSSETAAARAMRAAGGIDRQLREGKLAALKPGDTPRQRFATALEEAHVETARSLTSESYTTPDGVTIYRFRIGGKVFCRSAGHVRPRLGNLAEGGGAASFDVAGGGGAAGLVQCPAHAEFKRD